EPQAFARAAHIAAIEGDERGFEDAMRKLLGLRGGSYEAFALGFTRGLFQPLFVKPWHMTATYVADIVREVKDAKVGLMRKSATSVAPPPAMIFMNRLQFGFYSVLAELDVAVDYAKIEADFLREANLFPA